MVTPVFGSPSWLSGRRVLVTGHTGFKGAWLAAWLHECGARVSGIALAPETDDALFHVLDLAKRVDHIVCDVRDGKALTRAVAQADPEIVFHLAAQALVRRGYQDPVGTWQTNVVGTLNVLEAACALKRRTTVVAVTTDKVYRNRDWLTPYREADELGGHDPYSASKAACEIAVASWRASFGGANDVVVSTARAGNAIGGGDVSPDRLIADCYRAWQTNAPVILRRPNATRPWQHVLEPLSGYIALAHHLETDDVPMDTCNFGPGANGDRTVEHVVRMLAASDVKRKWVPGGEPEFYEARALALNIDRARSRLGWEPRLGFDEGLAWTDAGYSAPPTKLRGVIERQIADYESRLPPAAPAGGAAMVTAQRHRAGAVHG